MVLHIIDVDLITQVQQLICKYDYFVSDKKVNKTNVQNEACAIVEM